MKKYLVWIPVLLFVGLCLVLGKGLLLDDKRESVSMEREMPGFRLVSFNESIDKPGKFYTQEDLKGELFLLNFWATWCPSCRKEFSVLEKTAEEYGIKWVGINYKDDPLAVSDWLKKVGNPYSLILIDSDGKAGIEWGLIAVPETFLIDKQGVIRYKHTGPVTLENWENEIWPEICRWSENGFAKCPPK